MAKIVISDLHLQENRPQISDLFLNFLKNDAKHAEALYILGDFFESWIGDDDDSPFHKQIISALKTQTTLGLPIYFMRGNRDFLIGKRFLKATGCQPLPDEFVANMYGIPTLMMHGDTLCTQDVKYLKFRKKARNWFMQKLFLLKPLKTRQAMVKKYRDASKEHVSTLPLHIMDVTQSEVLQVMQKHQVSHLIHGHTHRQAIHHFDDNHKKYTRTVLGAWHDQGNAFIFKPSGNNEFVDII
ncbi:MAG TPA: UDP-2,3-diacylglucosamine diphosphatase [Gammaproteobacteria bacterium]|nr:UDP-2,3-diacylglucosamine diphosphatase [Gammaproteobacteria bacterium]